MQNAIKNMFYAVEINVLLWLGILMLTLRDNTVSPITGTVASDLRLIAFIGVAFAAVVQHWAYYALYKRAGELERSK